MEKNKIEWKSTLIKSLIYRSITVIIGMFMAYILTHSIIIATSIGILTEVVQGINYFIYELIWSNISRRKLEKRIIEKIKKKEIKLKIDYSSIEELIYVFSQIDTFDPKLYLSTLNMFNSMLENDELEEIREEIQKYKDHFVRVHSKRKLFFPDKKP